MGGRQRKKAGGGKKKRGGRGGKGASPAAAVAACPDIEEASDLLEQQHGLGGRGAEVVDEGALANANFDEALSALKQEEFGLGPDARAEAEAAAVASEEGWVKADTAYEDLQRACKAHVELWAKVDKLTPVRDEWYAKWEECEKLGLEEISLENQIQGQSLSGQAAKDKSKDYFAKARTLRASKKRLRLLNDEITCLTREILNLEERYPINSKRVIGEQMREAVLTDDPAKLMAAMKPSEEVQMEMLKRRAELLGRECDKYYGRHGLRNEGVLPGYSPEQIDELVARGVREGPQALRRQEKEAVSRSLRRGGEMAEAERARGGAAAGAGPAAGLPVGAGVVATGGGLAGVAQRPRGAPQGRAMQEGSEGAQHAEQVRELKARIAECKRLMAEEGARETKEATAVSSAD